MFCFPHPTEEWTGLLLKRRVRQVGLSSDQIRKLPFVPLKTTTFFTSPLILYNIFKIAKRVSRIRDSRFVNYRRRIWTNQFEFAFLSEIRGQTMTTQELSLCILFCERDEKRNQFFYAQNYKHINSHQSCTVLDLNKLFNHLKLTHDHDTTQA